MSGILRDLEMKIGWLKEEIDDSLLDVEKLHEAAQSERSRDRLALARTSLAVMQSSLDMLRQLVESEKAALVSARSDHAAYPRA